MSCDYPETDLRSDPLRDGAFSLLPYSMSSIIVDDQDARITYSGSWTLAGSDINYSQTLHSTNATGATMSFSFSGTSIAIVGDYGGGGTCSATLTLDGNVHSFISPSPSSVAHQQTIFDSSIITDGQHTLVYNLSSCQSLTDNTTGPYLWIDYLLYTPSANSTYDGVNFFIDDADPQLKYTGNWTLLGEDGDFRHTKHGGDAGSTMQFTFNGTSVSVHGRINNGTSGNTQGIFSVDGSSPTTFTAPPQSTISYNKLLFSTAANLSPGLHTLTVTSQSDTLLWIDYLLVQSESAPSPNTPPQAPTKSGLSIPAIVGIGIGSLVLITAAVVAVFLFLRRPGRPSSKQPAASQYEYTKPLAQDAASTLYRTEDGYSYIRPGQSSTAPPSTLHDYPPSSSSSRSYTESVATSSHPLLAPSRSPSCVHSRSHSRAHNVPPSSGVSSASSGLTRMRSGSLSHATDSESEPSSSNVSSRRRQPRRELPRVPNNVSYHSSRHAVHVDSGFRMSMDDPNFGDDKNPPEPPPAYTPR